MAIAFKLWRGCSSSSCCLVLANSERTISQSTVSKGLQGVMAEARVQAPPLPSAKYSGQRSLSRILGVSMDAQTSRWFDQSDASYGRQCGTASVPSLSEDATPCCQTRNTTRRVTDGLVSTIPLFITQHRKADKTTDAKYTFRLTMCKRRESWDLQRSL